MSETMVVWAVLVLAAVVVALCMIRLGYKSLLAEWALEAIDKAEDRELFKETMAAEKEFVGTKLGEARLAVVVAWLRERVPAPLRFLVTDELIRKVVQVTFDATRKGLEVMKNV